MGRDYRQVPDHQLAVRLPGLAGIGRSVGFDGAIDDKHDHSIQVVCK